MAIQIQLRGDTAANWTSVNPILASREVGLEIDTNKFKIGNGVTAWIGLPYGGIQGIQGFQGVDGSDGDDGLPGPPGATGPAGTPGSPGTPGAAGAQGSIGFGMDGDDGQDGAPIPGPQGPQGPQGTPGVTTTTTSFIYLDPDGPDEPSVVPGPQGPSGSAGSTGSTGPAGAPGAVIYMEGDQGEEGMMGPPGSGGTGGGGGVTQLLAGSNISLSPVGGTGIVTVSASGGAGASWTEGEVDFGSTPTYDTLFSLVDAAITSGASKVIIIESGKIATGRVASGDGGWDSIGFSALPAAGSAQVWAKAMPGPVVGKRKFQYTVA